MGTLLVGMFDTLSSAQDGVQRLIDAGIPREDIGILSGEGAEIDGSRHGSRDHPVAHAAVEGAESGAVVGGIAGALLALSPLTGPAGGAVLAGGWIVAALAGAGIGAAAGGIGHALVEAGLPHHLSVRAGEAVRQGRTAVTVRAAEDRRPEIERALRSSGAIEILPDLGSQD